MKRSVATAVLLLGPVLTFAQNAAPSPDASGSHLRLGPGIHQVLVRSSDGHSPSDEDIAAAASFDPMPNAEQVKGSLPDFELALRNPDLPVRLFALTALTGIQTPPEADGPGHPQSVPGAPLPTAYKPEIANVLASLIPQIAPHLTEESQAARVLTVKILSGFTPNPPATVFPPLYAYLRRDDGVGPTGTSIVEALLHYGPISEPTSNAVNRYLHRSDQTSDSRSNLVDAIAQESNQSPALNKSLLDYMDGDDPTLEARVILSLPALDLTPDIFAEMKSRVAAIADDTTQNLQVVNAAKAIQPCWTRVRMTTGCPVY